MNLALGLFQLQGLVITSHPAVFRAEQLPMKKKHISPLNCQHFARRTQLSQTAPSFSATSVCHFFFRPKPSLHPRLACFLLLRTAFWCHLVTSQGIFSEFLSMFVLASHILRLKSDDGCKCCHDAKIMEHSPGASGSIPWAVTQPHPSEAFISPVLH